MFLFRMHIVVLGLVTILTFTRADYVDDSKSSLGYLVKGSGNIKLYDVFKELNKVYDECLKRKKTSCENELLTVEKRMKLEKMVTPPANGLWGKDSSNDNIPAKNVINASKRDFISNDNRLASFIGVNDVTKNGVEHLSGENNYQVKTALDAPQGPPTGGLWGRDFKGVFSAHLLNNKLSNVNAMVPRSNELNDVVPASMKNEEEKQEEESEEIQDEMDAEENQQPEINSLAPTNSVNGLWGRQSVKKDVDHLWSKEGTPKNTPPRNNPIDRFNAGLWGRVLHPEMEKGIQKPSVIETHSMINADVVKNNGEAARNDRPWKWETKRNIEAYQTGLWGKDISNKYKKIRGAVWRREQENKAKSILGRNQLDGQNAEKEVMNSRVKATKTNQRRNSKLTRTNKTSLDSTVTRRKDRSPRRMYYLRHSASSFA